MPAQTRGAVLRLAACVLSRFWWFLVVQTTVVGWGTAETAVAVPRQGFGQHVDHPLRACLLLWATFTCCLLSLVCTAHIGHPALIRSVDEVHEEEVNKREYAAFEQFC